MSAAEPKASTPSPRFDTDSILCVEQFQPSFKANCYAGLAR